MYHREIKQNAAKMEQIQRQQAQQEKLHREQQEKAAKQVAAAQAAGGVPGGKKPEQGGLGAAFTDLFKSPSAKEAERLAAQQAAAAAASAAAAAAAAAARKSSEEGPIRTLSGADEALLNNLNEEMAVSLSKRVEALEDERLSLTSQLESLKKRHANSELLNQLLSERGAAGGAPLTPAASKEEAALKAALKAAHASDDALNTTGGSSSSSSGSSGAPDKKKSGLLGGLLNKKDPASASVLNDPAKVRALLEESVLSNQSLSAEAERSSAEVRKLREQLALIKSERDEAIAKEKIAVAKTTTKTRKSVGPSLNATTTPTSTSTSAMSAVAAAKTKPDLSKSINETQ